MGKDFMGEIGTSESLQVGQDKLFPLILYTLASLFHLSYRIKQIKLNPYNKGHIRKVFFINCPIKIWEQWPILYPESSGSLASGWSPGETSCRN